MDVFSLLKFWRNAGVGDPIHAGDFDITDDEGSFFDLVFSNPNNLEDNDISGFHSDHYDHFSKMEAAGDSKSTNHFYSSPSPHPVFFNNKRKILPLDSSSNTNTKTPKSPFRVLMLGFQNNKGTKSDYKKEMKCEIEQVTISSLLSRDNSLRNKLRSEKFLDHDQIPSKRFSKDVVHKYLNMIKPLYIKSSKKSNDKVRLPEHSSVPSSSPAIASVFSPRKEDKTSVFKEVRKHLGKSRSSSSSSTAVKPIPSPATRRDDSVLQQQDGIQSAILHCKKSYNSPSQGCSILSRSGSAPSHGPRISIDEEKRSSI